MTQSFTVGHLLELAIALEQAAETFYRGLTGRFSHVLEAAAFWREYADEEAGHARWLENLHAQLDETKRRQPVEAALIEKGQALLKRLPEQTLDRITNLEEAYQAAVEMESSEINAIFEILVTDYAVTDRSRDFLREQLHHHAGKIGREFPAAFQGRAARLAVEAGPGA